MYIRDISKDNNTPANLTDFLDVPRILYKGNQANRVRLDFEMKEHISTKNPYFDHAQTKFFVAYDEKSDKPIGRISAQINDLSPKGEGHFGYIEAASKEVLGELLATAEQWLESKGVTHVTGPYSLSINDESGLLVEGFNLPPRIMMNYAQEWYAGEIEKSGYKVVKKLLAYDMDITKPLPGAATYMARQAADLEGMSERPVDMKNFNSDIKLIVDIFNDAWSDNWGFLPMTDDEVQAMAHNLKPVIKPELARIAFVDDEAAAMIVALPDINEAVHDLNGKLLPFGFAKFIWRLKVQGLPTARVLLMGVRQKYQQSVYASALSAYLIKSLHEQGGNAGVETMELSWILEDNKPVRRLIEMCGGYVTRQYHMYGKELG